MTMARFLFPFEKIEKGSRIILYGAGAAGREFYEQCYQTKYCEVILWADKRWREITPQKNWINISDITEIEHFSSQCDYVVIAVNSCGMKDEIVDYLLKYFEENKIVWRKPDFKEEKIWETTRRSAGKLCNIIPDFEYKKQHLTIACDNSMGKTSDSNRPIKVRFIVDIHYWWNVLESVAKEYLHDERYDVLVVGNGQRLRKGVQKYVIENGFHFETSLDYDVQKDCPDIVFVVEAVNNKIALMRNYAKLVICIHGSIIKWEGRYDIKIYLQDIYNHLMNIKPDYYIFDKLIYNELQYAHLTTAQTVLLGNPKFDHIYQFMQKETVYPPGWEKLKNKKVILWTTDHHCFGCNVSFDFYAKPILQFFEENPEFGLIFRPHPVYVEEMVYNRIWTQKELEFFRTYMHKSPNMVWDDRDSYDCAYRICDAVMADVDCGIICSSLPLGVPVGVLIRPEKNKYTQPELIDHLYQIRNMEELENFFKVVDSGIDPKREERLQAFHDNILFYDGNIGKRVKKFVSEIYEEKMREDLI